jgi:GNAT superfamily N-acetyltransferase
MSVIITLATEEHTKYAEFISEMTASASIERKTGISTRPPELIKQKMRASKAAVAMDNDVVAGFSYIETWGDGEFVSSSGLIVNPDYRKQQIARRLKTFLFNLARERYPDAILFGLTTSPAVMKLNNELGYQVAAFSDLPQDESFWKGCESCVNFDILSRTERKYCLCTGMIYNPKIDN